MGKIRVYELAKELEMESKDVIRRLGKMGSDVTNHMSAVDEEHAKMLRDIMRPKLMLEHKQTHTDSDSSESEKGKKDNKKNNDSPKAETSESKTKSGKSDKSGNSRKSQMVAADKQGKKSKKDSNPEEVKGAKAIKSTKATPTDENTPSKNSELDKPVNRDVKDDISGSPAQKKNNDGHKNSVESDVISDTDSKDKADNNNNTKPEQPRKTGIFAKPNPNQPRKTGVFANKDKNQKYQRHKDNDQKSDRNRNKDGNNNGNRRPNNNQSDKNGQNYRNDRNNRNNNHSDQHGGFQNRNQDRQQNRDFHNNDSRNSGSNDNRNNYRGDHSNQNNRNGYQNRPQKQEKGFASQEQSNDAPSEKKEPRRFEQRKKNNNNSYGARKKDMERNRTENMYRSPKPNARKKKSVKEEIPAVVPKKVVIGDTVIISELAKAMSKTAAELIKALMGLGFMATVNQEIDAETASILGEEFGITVEVKVDDKMEILVDEEDAEETLESRPPIITVMGHVDHGKTSLLDAIRNTHVIAGEAGGITQAIGAYQVEINSRRITFLDTPGHEAFTEMRARGAQVTDIAVLVVAADDGVMPQTIEAINHAKAANVPIVVAINKIDKVGANIDKIRQELTEYELIDEEWGGNTIMVPISAKQHQGIDTLLEMILLVADMQELKANPNRNARGTVIESKLDKGRGPVATVLVQKGTLHVGDILVCGSEFAKVRAMVDDKGRRAKVATPAMPVEVLGFSDVPPAGEIFVCVDDEKDAHYIADRNAIEKREHNIDKTAMVSLDDLFRQISEGDVKELNIVLKADVHGSVEALTQSIINLSTDEVKVNIIHKGVGAIVETDVMLAEASNALIVGFNVRPDAMTKKAAEKAGVEILMYRVIYEAIDSIKAAMSGLLDPEFKETIIGHVEVRDVIRVPKVGSVAGCYVVDGKVIRNGKARVLRNGIVIHEGDIASLKRFKDDVKEVQTGFECGITVEDYNDIKVEDQIEIFEMVETKRTID